MNIIYRTHLILAIGVGLIGGLVIQPDVTAKRVDGCYQDQNSSEWRRYTVKGEEFSALLPVVPAMSTSSVYIDENRSRRERVLGAYANGVAYAIYTFERKSLSLDDVISRFANYIHPTDKTEDPTISGIVGKSYRFATGDRVGAIQFFVTKQNLYVFQALGSTLGDPSAGIPKFLSSVRFEQNPEGRKVDDGPGEQPVSNTQSTEATASVFTGRQVAIKVSVVTKPEPRYTEEARRNQIAGTVVLRAVFSSSGSVTNIHAVSGLADGLTERAIEAARQIRFIPAIKDGRFVSTWIELQYNFNLY